MREGADQGEKGMILSTFFFSIDVFAAGGEEGAERDASALRQPHAVDESVSGETVREHERETR